jgi:ABC-type sugar transport system permease subunit
MERHRKNEVPGIGKFYQSFFRFHFYYGLEKQPCLGNPVSVSHYDCGPELCGYPKQAIPGPDFFSGVFYFPAVIAPISVAIIWRWVYNPGFGFINQFFAAIGSGFRQNWISSPNVSLYAIFSASLWQSVCQPMIFFLAGLQTVPEEVLEAATIDGASNARRFFVVTIPMMKETFVIVVANLIVHSLKVFDVVMGLTAGGPNNATEMMSTYMYSQTFRYNNVGYGTAVAVLMVVFMLIVIVPYVKFTAGKD